MTSNEIAAKQAKTAEMESRNRDAREREKNAETKRSNKAKEKLTGTKIMADASFAAFDRANPLSYISKGFSSRNDPNWYTRNPQMAKDAANISWFNPTSEYPETLGNIIAKLPTDTVFTSNNVFSKSVQGLVMALDVVPTVGTATGVASDPINIASRLLFTKVRRANAGSTNYDPVDLMIYFINTDSAYAFAAHMARVYGILNYYSVQNLSLPDSLCRALLIDGEDFRSHMADFRFFINTYIAKLQTRTLPRDFSVLERHWQLFSGVYLDAPNSDKAQLYVIRPAGFYVYEVDSTGAGMCKYKPYVTINQDEEEHVYTYDEFVTYATDIIDKLFLSQDAAIMSGDILKAYDNNVYVVSQFNPDYTVQPGYDLHMLTQISCATYFDPEYRYEFGNTNAGFNLTQLDGNLMMGDISHSVPIQLNLTSDVNQGLSAVFNPEEIQLNIPNEASTDAGYVLEYTRMVPDAKYRIKEGGDGIVIGYDAWGSEIPVGIHFYASLTGINGVMELTVPTPTYSIKLENVVNNTSELVPLPGIALISQFDWHPRWWVGEGYLTADRSITSFAAHGYVGDVQNYTYISRHVLGKMHQAALLSQFNVV